MRPQPWREWFPAKERSVAIGWFNIGSSFGALLAPPLVVWAILHSGWQLAFIIVGALGILWSLIWLWLYKHPRDQKHLGDAERDYILSGQEEHFKDPVSKKGSWKKVVISRNFFAIASARFLSEPAWQTFNAWIPLYLMTERHMNIKEIAMFAWLPFLAADLGCILGGYLSPFFHKHLKVSLFTSRKMVMFPCSVSAALPTRRSRVRCMRSPPTLSARTKWLPPPVSAACSATSARRCSPCCWASW